MPAEIDEPYVWITDVPTVTRLCGPPLPPRPRRRAVPVLLEALPYRKDDVTASYAAEYRRATRRGGLRGAARRPARHRLVGGDRHRRVPRRRAQPTCARRSSGSPRSRGRTAGSACSARRTRASTRCRWRPSGAPGLARGVSPSTPPTTATPTTSTTCGGVLRALDLVDYPLYMIAMNALPPVPARVRRRAGATSGAAGIDEHASRGCSSGSTSRRRPDWRRGSIAARAPDGARATSASGARRCSIVGWADGYRNNSFRVVEQYQRNGLPWRLLAGPWVHKSPERARPGPNVDDDVEMLAFFDEHLRDDPPSPSARGAGVRPRAGRARARPRAPSPAAGSSSTTGRAPRRRRCWRLGARRHRRAGGARRRRRGRVELVRRRAARGASRSTSAHDNARSLVYDWPIARAATSSPATGHARSLRVRTDRAVRPRQRQALRRVPRRHVDADHARHARPDAPRVLAGRRPRRGRPRAARRSCPASGSTSTIAFEATTWTLAAGPRAPARDRRHRLAELLAAARAGDARGRRRDVCASSCPDRATCPTSAHTFVPGAGPSADEADGRGVADRARRARPRHRGRSPATAAPTTGEHAAIVTDDYRGDVGVSTLNPADAWAHGVSTFEIEWPDVRCRSRAELTVRSDATSFHVDVVLQVSESDDVIAERSWTASVPRSPWSSA